MQVLQVCMEQEPVIHKDVMYAGFAWSKNLSFNARAKRKKCSNWRQSAWAVNGKPTFTLILVLHDRSGVPEYHPVSMVKAV